MKIYIVQGDNGEQYEDQRDWSVIAYDSLSLAEQHAAHAEARSAAIKRIEHQRGWGVARTESNEFDPIVQCPGAQYYVYPLDLIVQPPKDCRRCSGTGFVEQHQPGHTHYETDAGEPCPAYHYRKVPCVCVCRAEPGDKKSPPEGERQ